MCLIVIVVATAVWKPLKRREEDKKVTSTKHFINTSTATHVPFPLPGRRSVKTRPIHPAACRTLARPSGTPPTKKAESDNPFHRVLACVQQLPRPQDIVRGGHFTLSQERRGEDSLT